MAHQELLFGTAGIPRSCPGKTTVDGVKHVRKLGLDAMELEFVYGVRMRRELANEVRKTAGEAKVKLSVHAPYYINLNAQDEAKLQASKQRILDSALMGSLAGAKSIVFHPGFYLKMEKEQVYQRVKEVLEGLVTELRSGKLTFASVPRPRARAPSSAALTNC